MDTPDQQRPDQRAGAQEHEGQVHQVMLWRAKGLAVPPTANGVPEVADGVPAPAVVRTPVIGNDNLHDEVLHA